MSRGLATAVFLYQVVHWYIVETSSIASLFSIALLLPLLIIWLSGPLSNFTGWIILGRISFDLAYVDEKTPSFLIQIFGWVFLLVPIWHPWLKSLL